jgi:hypothetical protein
MELPWLDLAVQGCRRVSQSEVRQQVATARYGRVGVMEGTRLSSTGSR